MEIADDLDLARHMAAVAAEIALSYFRSPIRTELKADGSQVSEADLAVDHLLIDILTARRPDDSVLTEESGQREGSSGRRWIIDPIDGTSSFLDGRRDWGTHIALEVDGILQVAVFSRPTEDLVYWATRHGGTFRGTIGMGGASQRLTLAAPESLQEWRVGGMVSEPSSDAEVLKTLATWVVDDVSTVTALLEGRIHAFVDDAGHIWDQAPAVLLVQEAGGSFTDPDGGTRCDMRWGLYCHPSLRDTLMAALG